MDRPCVARGFGDGEVGLALMYPALRGAELLAIMDIRAHRFSLADRPFRPLGSPEHQCDGATVLHLVFVSQTSASSERLMHVVTEAVTLIECNSSLAQLKGTSEYRVGSTQVPEPLLREQVRQLCM